MGEVDKLTQFLKKIFSRDASILCSCMLFCLFFTSYKVDVKWLSEIAEGLKNVTTSLNKVVLSVKSLPMETLVIDGFE